MQRANLDHSTTRNLIKSAPAWLVDWFLTGVFLVSIYHAPQLAAGLAAYLPQPTVQTSALAGCRAPEAGEQLHVVWQDRDGIPVRDGCLYVTARGAAKAAR